MRSRSQTIESLNRGATGRAPEPGRDDKTPDVRGYVRRWLHGAFFDNVGLKFLSLVLALTVFLLINTDKDREITLSVPVKYDVPADKVLVSDTIPSVDVTLKGPWRRLRRVADRELGVIRLDLRNAPSGDLELRPDMIPNVPDGLTVTSVDPRSVRVQFDKRVDKLVEVVASTAGRPQHGYVVAEVKAVPPTVRVRGGERLLAALSSIRTVEISLEGRTDSFEQLAELAAPEGVETDPTQRISVHVRIEEELVTRKVSMPVTVQGDGIDPARWTVTPAQVDVTLTGELLAIEAAKTAMVPTVKLDKKTAKPDEPNARAREVDVRIEGLPRGVGVRISPERVTVAPKPF
ncbi:MAG TPA: CdaR family protein [Kofleriaceae bacterium]|nr:CdaR family protein [Kofleriaceae bacterium]